MTKIMLFAVVSLQLMAFDMGDNLLKETKAGWRGAFTGITCPDESDCKSVWFYSNDAKGSDEKFFIQDGKVYIDDDNPTGISKKGFQETSDNNVTQKLTENAKKAESTKTQEWVKKITLGLNTENSSTLRADIYTGAIGNAGALIHLKSTMTQDSKATDDEVASDFLLDYNGGSFNFRFDIQDFVRKIYRAENDGNLSNGDAWGVSLQSGIKGQPLTRIVNDVAEDHVEYIPYVGLVGQMDFGIYNEKDIAKREGIFQVGAHVSYEYLNQKIVDLLNDDVEKHEGILGAYANFFVSKIASINVSYSTNMSHFQERKRFFISFNLYPKSD